MDNTGLLDPFPFWELLLVTVILVFLSVEIGYQLARRRGRPEDEKENPIISMVGATIGLLAFMLAFTFGLAWSRFDDRRQAVLDEANAIRTAYLRTAMLPEPMRTDTGNLLREYVDVRLEGANAGKADQAVLKSEELQGLLW